jgi:hypothetical protein
VVTNPVSVLSGMGVGLVGMARAYCARADARTSWRTLFPSNPDFEWENPHEEAKVCKWSREGERVNSGGTFFGTVEGFESSDPDSKEVLSLAFGFGWVG